MFVAFGDMTEADRNAETDSTKKKTAFSDSLKMVGDPGFRGLLRYSVERRRS